MNEIKEYTETVFEDIKHIDELGNEYWLARELMPLLEYSKWENFDNVIQKAVISYKNSNNDDSYWLPEVRKPIITGKGKEEFIKDYKLSRYICYLIVQNANPKKKMVALGQTYFAIQTRKQELSEKEIIDKYDIPNIDLLKVGHHGSKTSSSKEFINEIKPKYSIISVGKNNRYGHPNKEVLNNLENSKIYRTDKDGSILFKIKNNKLKIETCIP